MSDRIIHEREVREALARDERAAERMFGRTRETSLLLADAVRKSQRNRRKLRSAWRDLSALLRMLRAWKDRTYTKLPKKTIVAALAAVVYFVNPMDLMPDVIPLLGFIDDAAVLGLVMAAIRDDLERFQEWEGTIEM